jgi:hypothetical protein
MAFLRLVSYNGSSSPSRPCLRYFGSHSEALCAHPRQEAFLALGTFHSSMSKMLSPPQLSQCHSNRAQPEVIAGLCVGCVCAIKPHAQNHGAVAAVQVHRRTVHTAVEAFQDEAAGREGAAKIPRAGAQDDWRWCDSNKAVA